MTKGTPRTEQWGATKSAWGRWGSGVLALAVLLAGLAMTLFLWREATQREEANLRASFAAGADMALNNVHGRLRAYSTVMRGVSGFFEGSDTISHAEFRAYVAALRLDKHVEVKGVGLVRLIPAAERQQHEQSVRREYFPDYEIHPVGARDEYAPIVFMEPLDRENRRAIGLDTLTVPVAREAMIRARETGDIAITAPLTLVQDAEDRPGTTAFVMYLPLFAPRAGGAAKAIQGWVDVPFRMDDLMAGLVGEIDPSIAIEIVDDSPGAPAALLYRSQTAVATMGLAASLTAYRSLEVGGRHWTLRFRPTPAFMTAHAPENRSRLLLLAGASLSIALSLLTLALGLARRRAQAHYRQLFDEAVDGFIVVSEKLQIVDANPAALKMLGYPREELLSLPGTGLSPPEEAELAETSFRRMMAGETVRQEFTYLRKDGSRISVDLRGSRLHNGGYLGVLRDLTERKVAEQRIAHLTRLYKALSEVNQAIVRMHDEDELFPLVCRCAVDFGGMRLAWVGLFDAEKNLVRPVCAFGGTPELNARIDKVPVAGREMPLDSLHEGHPIIANDIARDAVSAGWASASIAIGCLSGASFPVFRAGKPFATLNVGHAECNAFDAEMVALLTEMAGDIGFALDNFDREKERLTLAHELDDAYRRMMNIINVSPAVIYTLAPTKGGDSEFTIDFISDTVERLTGYPVEECCAPGFFLARVHPDDWADARVAQKHLEANGFSVNQFRLRHADGSYRWIESQARMVRDATGGVIDIVGAWLDITSTKQFEEELRGKERMLSESQRIARIGSWHFDIPANRLTWSEEAYRLYHVDRDSFVPSRESLLELMLPEDRHVVDESIEWVMADKPPRLIVYRIRTPEGDVRFIEGQGELKRDPDGRPVSLDGTVQDVTERILASQQLELNATVFETSREGIVITDVDNRLLTVNRAYCEMLGYTREELLRYGSVILSEKDMPEYTALLQEARATGYWQGQVWTQRKDGERIPVWLSLSVVRDATGLITHQVGVMSDVSEHVAAKERIVFLSNFDPLTSLPNRSLLSDRTHLALATARRENGSVAMMYLDLDRFKILNDSLGPSAGDQILKDLALRMLRELHQDDTLCRPGGDEFIVLLPSTDAEGAAHVARKMLDIIARPFTIGEQQITFTASIGIAMHPQDGGDFEQLAQAADAALYRAKQNGRNNFQFFTRQMHEQASEMLWLESELRGALSRDELALHFQPQVDATNGRIIGAEALLRWSHPERGMIPPARFIPVAEESGLIIDVGRWVIEQAARQLVDWQREGLAIVPVAVNISVAQFAHATLHPTVVQVLRDHALDPAMLELEVTEGIAMLDYESTARQLDQLHALGVTLSIDDFGTGYSSLSYLKRFHIDKLKIDQSFVRDLATSADSEGIVTAIIDMARSLGFRTIAEGVETRDQLDFLRQRRCDEIQGYFFSKPVPAEEFAELLRTRRVFAVEG